MGFNSGFKGLMKSEQNFKCVANNADDPAWVASRRLLTIDV